MTRLLLVLSVLVVAAALAVAPISASEPAQSIVTAPTGDGEVATAEWTGTVNPGTDPDSSCAGGSPSEDRHTIVLEVPEDFPEALSYFVQVQIDWQPNGGASSTSDLILTLVRVNGDEREEVATSDGGSPTEGVAVQELPAGTYEAIACAFANAAPQDYRGTVRVLTAAASNPEPAPADGLEFSASVPADIQRDEGEPIIEIDGDGTIYTCGPTGFSQAEDYLQVSTDGGDQFHLLGEPPRGQQSLGGGGDCGLGTGLQRNDDGNFQLAYVGLSGLLDFTTSTSADRGRTLTSSPVAPAGPGVDRQWIAFSDADTVFLNYNRVSPRAVTVQRSDNGGLTYRPPEVVSPDPDFPGPIRAMPPELNPLGNGEPVVYYPWTQGTSLRLAVSLDHGETFRNCTAAQALGDPSTLFAVADHDNAGNIYIAYTDQGDFNTRIVHAPAEALTRCAGSTTAGDPAVKDNPGFSTPVQVNGGGLVTTVFPWIAAGGEPGRVAISYYGTTTDGRADDAELKTSWNVYVAQSLNALDADATFSQVKVTTHPNHYDQICLLGLGCSAGGDRSLVDFFAIDYNPVNGEYALVYNRAHKRPDDEAGTVSSPIVAHQIAGPSNNGGRVESGEPPPLRSESTDLTEDAIADYSSLGDPPNSTYVPAMDVTRVRVLPEQDLETDVEVEEGGFTVEMTLADLSDDALRQALRATESQSLLWIFRYVDGYRYSAASARFSVDGRFTFGHNGYVGSPGECGPPEQENGDQCLLYPGDTPLQGEVDQEAGVIRVRVPRDLLTALEGGEGPGERPAEVPAEPGDRIYDAAVFAQSNTVSPTQDVQSFLYPLDNSPAMDFLVPGGPPPPAPETPETPEAPETPDDAPAIVARLAGRTRIGTAAAISSALHESADTVVVARAFDYADALAGGPLAVHLNAPLLLSEPERLSEEAAEEIRRLGADEAVLLGGEGALSPQVERDLEAMGLVVRRVAGGNRFDTATRIAAALPETDEVFVAEGDSAIAGRGFPDALSAAGLASAQRKPVLLVLRDSLPPETANALAADVDATIVGGTGAVSEDVARRIDDRVDAVVRLSGASRYDTSRTVAEEALARGLTPAQAWVATGLDFADGLVAGAAAGATDGILLLVDGQDITDSPATAAFLEDHADAVSTLHLSGGTAAISARAEDQLRRILER
jgi:putative cell wall-binding protein